MLLGMGCDSGQGYLFAAALSEEEALHTVRRAAVLGGTMWSQGESARAA